MFFRRKKQHKAKALCDFVEMTNDTGYVFVNINNDLGEAVENGVDNWPPLMLMAYGYARRAAVAALYIQGIVEEDLYDHVKTFFKGMQIKTGHTVEFQEQAFAEAVKFMKGYSQVITSFSVKKIVQIAEEYEKPPGTLSDAELFENIIETAHFEQNAYSSNAHSTRTDDAVKNITQGVNSRIGSKNIALQFVLEELDAARQGNEAAIQFVKNSGFSPSEYEGAMQKSFEEVDGPDGPQQFLRSSVMQYSSDMDFMINLRLQIVENIINDWGLKTQSNEEDSSSNAGDEFWKWVQNNCSSVKFKPQEIETWSDLKELELRTNDLSELSDDISILTGLVDLSLFHNNFSIVPEVVFNLTELKWLNFGVNQIVELPRGIGRLTKLKILDLGQNQLINLPREIGELKNLEQLIVHNNNLSSLPIDIGEMTALKHISLYENNLIDLPDEILNLSNLETIELQDNNFTNESIKKWTDRFSNTKCKISFGYQKGNISDPIYVETNIKGGSLEDSFHEIYLNSKDEDTVSNIFRWSSSDVDADEGDFLSMYMANKKYNKISINEGLNAINSENNIVPINMELNAETPSAEDELIGWVKIIYVETCNEHNLKPNTKLRIVSVGSSGSEKTLTMMEL
jgi:Leucine-rich repeat (LRR) protein